MNKEIKSKEDKYKIIIDNLQNMNSTYNNLNLIAKMASISSSIKMEFQEFTFVGFYMVVNSSNLEIGPYVSSILATPRIGFGKGVCGTCWEKRETRIENNVRKCNNYIACSPDVLSEIVIPVFDKINNEVIAVLDIDCKSLDYFDEMDKNYLERILADFI